MPMPMTSIGGIEVSRIVCGSNTFFGYSHFSGARDRWLKRHFDTPKIVEVLAKCAFIGLDLRVRESGKHKGKRKLSKRGDPEARHLLYMAALATSQQPGPFADLRAHYLERGFTKTEAAVFIARKLARVAWAIYTKKQPYRADRVLGQPVSPSHSADNGMETIPSPSNAFAAPPTLSRSHSTVQPERQRRSANQPSGKTT